MGSNTIKAVSIVGARPNFVKEVMINRCLTMRGVHEILIHTGQHYDYTMSQTFFDQLDIPTPHYNLGVGSAPHGRQTGIMLMKIEEILMKEKPDWVILYGDTNSTLAGALVASKLGLKIAHIEAGLRSYNRSMPEEVNRVITDHLSDLLLCPVARAVQNLAREGISHGVYEVGDVMYDVMLNFISIAEARSRILEYLSLPKKAYLLATIHRPSNTDNPLRMKDILIAFGQLEEQIVLPAHPRLKRAIKNTGLSLPGNVMMTDPVMYLDMLVLEKNARLIMTDSGGVQKEAYFHGVPCLTLREETEWVETVEAGWNRIVGTIPEKIIFSVREFRPAAAGPCLFGDGHSADRIVELLLSTTSCRG